MKLDLRLLRRAAILAFASLAILCRCIDAAAQGTESPAAGPLSVDQCIETALANNPGLATARAQLTGSEGRRQSSYSAYLPTVNLRSGFNRDASWLLDPPVVVIDDLGRVVTIVPQHRGYLNSWSLSASVSQNLIAPSAWMLSKAAGSDVVAARESLRAARAELVYQVRQAYFLLVRAILLEQVTAEALKVSDAQASRSQAMFDVGSVARSDVLQASVNRASSERDEINARNGIDQQKALLAALMGADVGAPLEVRTDIAEVPATEYDEQGLVREALDIRPEIRQTRAQVRSARLRDRSAFWNLWPTVEGGLSYQKATANFGGIANLDSFDSPNATWGLSIGLNWNVFDGLASIGGLKTAGANVAIARESQRQEELNAAVGIREALVAIRNAREGMAAAEHGVSLAEENLRLQQALYENGGGTILDLNTAQAALTKARIDSVDAGISLRLAVALLDRAVGAER
jgi:outer membrane protein TolC